MGGCFSVSLSCDQALNQVSSCICAKAAYIRNLEENLEALQNRMQELKERQDDLLTKVRSEENKGLQCRAVVQGWLSRVGVIESRVNELLRRENVEIQRLCLCSCASKNCVSSYRYGKKVLKTKQDVEALKSESETFVVVAQEAPAPKVDERPIEPPVGTETTLEEAWKRLMDDEVGILGLYGMGGVGKTSLLTQINNKFCGSMNEFDVVIWVTVSQHLRPDMIQEEIRKKLKIINEGWQQKRQDEKASDILKALSRKKFVLLLDDIWEKVNLTEIGIPFPDRRNGCKVAFTTRSREVCGRMRAKDEIEVRCLTTDVAWDLFRKRVGENTLKSHPDIPEFAKTVAKRCRGLPLALNIIGETMARKTMVEEWHHAIDVLTSSAADFPGIKDEILPILKFSYDNLKEEKVKSCFLYCALFPEDRMVYKRWLVDYWVGEGIVDGKKETGRVENEGYEIIGILLRACLLEKGRNEESIKMHDVVREMALWISSDYGEKKENFFVQAGVGLDQIPKVENWKGVSRMSLMRNKIVNINASPNCPRLLTLFLNENRLVNIPSGFFQSMPNLVVLDLSYNCGLEDIPEEVSMLVSLQYVNLSVTGIRQLPSGVKELKKLVYLNLEYILELQSVDGISSLSNLQILRLAWSNLPLSLSLVEELQLLEHLNCLTINITGDALVLERFQSVPKLARCTEGLRIRELRGISLMADLDRLRELVISVSDISEVKIDWERKPSRMVSPLHYRKSPDKSRFPNHLRSVRIGSCIGLRDLTWLLFAPNIHKLSLYDLRDLKEIISKEKVVNDTREQPFGKLERLRLNSLPQLETIYWDPLPFPFLESISVIDCPKLRKLPVNSKSAEGNKLVIDADGQLEWEDEDTKQRFCSDFPSDSFDGKSAKRRNAIHTFAHLKIQTAYEIQFLFHSACDKFTFPLSLF